MHTTPVSTIHHKNNVLSVTISALVTRGAVKPIESKDVSKNTVIWKICNGGKFSQHKFPERLE